MLYPSSYTHARNLNYFILELIPEITISIFINSFSRLSTSTSPFHLISFDILLSLTLLKTLQLNHSFALQTSTE